VRCERIRVACDHPTDLQKSALPPWPKQAWGMPPAQEAAWVCHRDAG